MNLSDFLAFYLLLLLLSTLIITGFYIITRGEKITLPNGKYRHRGKILKAWSLFWEQITDYNHIYYKGAELEKKFQYLLQCNADFCDKLFYDKKEDCYLQIRQTLSIVDISYIKDVLQCEAVMDVLGKSLLLYNEEPNYYFPEWLRFPLSQCPPCMASIGGTMVYWPVMLFAGNVFAWANYVPAAYIYFWIIFCFALSALNKLAYNIIGA